MSVRTANCRSCDASIVWMVTEAGRNIPVDTDTVDEETLEFEPASPTRRTASPKFDPEEHTSHFATCPNADSHRRPR